MTSSDHQRSSTYATGPSISPVESGAICSGWIEEDEEEYEYEYEEIEVEEEIEEEGEDEIEVEEDEDPEEEEEEETTMKELEEEEEDPEEVPEEEEEVEDEDEEVEDDGEEEQVQIVQEETSTGGAPNASIAVPNDDASQDLSPKRHDDCSKSNLSNSMINLETMAASKSDCAVGNMTDDKSSGPLERLIRNVEIDSDDQSARKDVVMSSGCQLEVHTGGDKGVDRAKMLKRDHINYQEKDCSSSSKSDCAFGHMTDDKSSGPLERLVRNVEIDGDDQSSRKDAVMSNVCQLEVHAGGDKDVHLAQTLKRAHIDFQEKDCSSGIGAKLDKLMDVKDGQVPHFNEKEIILESSFKGDTGAEITPVSDSKQIDEQSDMQTMDGISKSASRFSAPLTRCRSASPKSEGNDREKRPAIVCEFFAKGWCIKGSACRFVHKRVNTGNTSQILGEDIALQNSNGGSRELAESPSHPNGSGFITSRRDTTGGVLNQNILSDMPIVSRSSSEVHHSFSGHESGLRGLGLSFSSHPGNQLSYHTSTEEATLRPGQYMPNDHNASGVGHSMNHSRMHDWRSHFSSHSSLRQDAFRSSLVPSSGASMERSYHASISRESRFSYGYKSKFIPYKWEPSTPFRTSSFSVPSLSTSSPECQYDPVRDSIEKPEEDTSVKASAGAGLLFHGKSYSWNPEKRPSVSDQKDMLMMEAESAATSATDAEAHTNMPKDVECGTNHQNNASRHRIEQKVEKEWQSSEMDLDPAEFVDIHRESKALKHFRAALIEFVKELLRPMWHEGVLTKDAFKIIVQKAEEKVVNSLQTNQIPATGEQINQYLSSSQSKILKLLEGYAAKYRKSMSSQLLV